MSERELLTPEQHETLAPFFDDYAVKFSKYKDLKAQLHELSKEMHQAWEAARDSKSALENATLELLSNEKA